MNFSEFYQAVHGYPPFPWQARLVEKIAREGRWPETIALPTSSGKTSVIDVAVFLLAMQADLPMSKRTAALRLFFVVDRRLVVDEAAEHARKIAEALAEPAVPAVQEVAARLSRFDGRVPLHVSIMRGGTYRDDSWLDSPTQPTVCLSTVDQVGSRLLFRAYGASRRQRPVHAALVATDSLIVVDEAHLSQPFLDTLQSIKRYQKWRRVQTVPGLQVVQMSATARGDSIPYKLQAEDLDNPLLRKRLHASKQVELVKARGNFEAEAFTRAKDCMNQSGVNVVGVVVNRVASAREIFTLLGSTKHDVVLLTGRISPYDRDRLLAGFLPRMKAGRNRSQDTPLFVVATQTVEVGADLDFDALVTEAAPLDALRQRFGRLDRLGERGETHAVILLRQQKRDDFVYGDALISTWEWLNAHKISNFGVMALQAAIDEHGKEGLNTRPSHAPMMRPEDLDTWCSSEGGSDVGAYLHGPEALRAADVQIAWRADLNRENQDHWVDIVSLAAPITRELLPVSASVVRLWLTGQIVDTVDVEGISEVEPEGRGAERRSFLVWRGDESFVSADPSQISPGDTIVVPASYGGADEFGWNPTQSAPSRDFGDLAVNEQAAAGMRNYRLRLHPAVLGIGGLAGAIAELRLAIEAGESPDEPLEAVFGLLRVAGFDAPQTVAAIKIKPYPAGEGYVIAWRFVESEGTDVDDTSSFRRRPVTLADHSRGVETRARGFAAGLQEGLASDVVLAAALHDVGKCDPRFQVLLLGGSPVRASAQPEPLAKSASAFALAEYRAALATSGYPRGMRHELVSVALARKSAALQRANDPELVLHLIGSHHGYGRPMVPAISDPEPVRVVADYNGERLEASSDHGLERLGSGWVDQFWALTGRYGYWGLAYLESVLRQADSVQSREEQR
ncbi:MAG: type I-U CRISPR-associated helicase/endonuclease Cas3 [Gemmatimonadetes bacterium]|nr:type I-U CRISPR-associated helicase/endonuclease Cas3 [Gemmatimonadota bacterium]